MLTGAVYGRDIESAWTRLGPDAVIGTVYATTETARIATHTVHRDDAYEADELLPVGRPYDVVALRIENEAGKSAAAGERGQLLVRSPYLARGDFSDQAATDARFERCVDGTAEYRTGDLAAIDTDGLLRIYGRQDGVVKVRMQRIDLTEIDAVLLSLPAVRSAASYVRAAGTEQECVAALIVLHECATLDMTTLRDGLAARLPA